MATIVTINKIIDLFTDYQESHPSLSMIGYGPTSEIGTTTQMTFPYLWISHQPNSTIKISNKTATPELSFYLLFVDQIYDIANTEDINGNKSTNEQDVLSDMFQVLQDTIIHIYNTWQPYGITIASDVACYPTQDETNDKVSGWIAEITLRLPYNNCTIPTRL